MMEKKLDQLKQKLEKNLAIVRETKEKHLNKMKENNWSDSFRFDYAADYFASCDMERFYVFFLKVVEEKYDEETLTERVNKLLYYKIERYMGITVSKSTSTARLAEYEVNMYVYKEICEALHKMMDRLEIEIDSTNQTLLGILHIW